MTTAEKSPWRSKLPAELQGQDAFGAERRGLARATEHYIARHAAKDEATVKALLGQWVSGLEPEILRDENNCITGLTIAGIPIGEVAPVVVANPDYMTVAEINRLSGDRSFDRYPDRWE